jgi:hypothetical protein
MAPLNTHLIVGERVFAQLRQFDSTSCGAFLLGCVLVDVHGFSKIDRRVTHFVGRLNEDGKDAFQKSCDNFLKRLATLLIHPWHELEQQEQAFVTGYLCHLATDEVSKQMTYEMMQKLDITSLTNLPVPGGILLSAFASLTSEMYGDFASIASALHAVEVPQVLLHVPHENFQAMWDIAQDWLANGCPYELYIEMLKRMGKTEMQIETARRERRFYWDEAVTLVREMGKVEYIVNASVQRSCKMIPRLQMTP